MLFVPVGSLSRQASLRDPPTPGGNSNAPPHPHPLPILQSTFHTGNLSLQA